MENPTPPEGWDVEAVKRLIAAIRDPNPERIEWENLANEILHDPWRALFPPPKKTDHPRVRKAICDECGCIAWWPKPVDPMGDAGDCQRCDCGTLMAFEWLHPNGAIETVPGFDVEAGEAGDCDWEWGYGHEKGSDDNA